LTSLVKISFHFSLFRVFDCVGHSVLLFIKMATLYSHKPVIWCDRIWWIGSCWPLLCWLFCVGYLLDSCQFASHGYCYFYWSTE